MRRLVFVSLALASLLGASLAHASLDTGLIGHWSLDDGTAHDVSGHGHDGVLFGGTPIAGPVNGALEMAPGHYIDCGTHPDFNPVDGITLAAWYRPVSFVGSGNDPIFDKPYVVHGWPYYQYHLGVSGNQYGVTPGNFGFNLTLSGVQAGAGTTTFGWQPGVWYHLAATYDGAMVRLYINGAEVDAHPATGTIDAYPTGLRIGAFGNLPYTLPGGLDDLRLYDRGLSAAEVGALYDTQPTATQPVTWGTMKSLYLDRH